MAAVFVASLITLAAVAWWSQRGYRRCISCHRQFATVADRRHHEKAAHSL